MDKKRKKVKQVFRIGDKVRIVVNNISDISFEYEYEYEYIQNNPNKIYTIKKILDDFPLYPYQLDDEALENISFSEEELTLVDDGEIIALFDWLQNIADKILKSMDVKEQDNKAVIKISRPAEEDTK